MSPIWSNWPGEQVCAPSAIVRPTSEAELADVIAQAAKRGERVRAVGSGHSFTDIACTDGVMIDMTGLQRVLDVDQPTGLVTVEGGAKLRALGPQLAQRRLGLENQGDVDPQSITGATATATHGTGVRFQNLSARIVSLRLVTAGGEVLSLSEGDDYLAARVSLGALGVISQVTLQTVPLFTLHRHDQRRSLAQTLERLDEFVDGNDHFEFFVFPYADKALTRTMHRSDEQPKPTPGWQRMVGENFENGGLSLICQTGRRFPSVAPRLNRLMTNMMSSSTVQDPPTRSLRPNARSGSPRWSTRSRVKTGARRSSVSSTLCAVAACRSCFRLRCDSPPPTIPSCRPHMGATLATSRFINTPVWSSKATSAPSRRSWTTTPVGHTGVNVTIRPPPRFVSAIRSGIGSPRFAIASIRTGCFSTTTPGAFSVPDNESTNPRGVRPISRRSQPRTDISGGMA